jgi:ABC-type phosphate/phosphonate transport system substrate-binding protein
MPHMSATSHNVASVDDDFNQLANDGHDACMAAVAVHSTKVTQICGWTL